MKEEFQKLGIIFTDTDSALKEYPDLFKQYFAKLVPPTDNKLAALNSAVWSGGTFIYVPKGVKVDIPFKLTSRINNENTGQFERTLIIVDEGASPLRRRMYSANLFKQQLACGHRRNLRLGRSLYALYDYPKLV